MTRHLDAVVIGAGPAGLTAARVIASSGLSCLLIDKMGPGGQLMNMGEVHEYPAIAPGTTGPDLLSTLLDEAMTSGAELAVDEVTGIDGGTPWRISAAEAPVTATAVIVATGLGAGTTGLDEEPLYEGRGLSHCAICDGPLHVGKRVAVAGAGDWAAQEAIDLAQMAAHVTLVSGDTSGRTLASVTPERQAKLATLRNLRTVQGRVAALAGIDGLDAVVVATSGASLRIDASGLFVFSDRKPQTDFLGARLATTLSGHIEAGPDQHASAAGIFACGDVASPAERIVMAIADGEKAGQNAVRWVKSRLA